MKTTALPILENKLSIHFEKCKGFIIAKSEGDRLVSKKYHKVHLPADFFPFWLAKNKVNDVITIQCKESTIHKLNLLKINVYTGVNSLEPNKLINDIIKGTLVTSDIN
jgi:predicted Fe-Mo cluster-binding NifX family protein